MCPRGQAIVADGLRGIQGDHHCLGLLDAPGKGYEPTGEIQFVFEEEACSDKVFIFACPQKLIASLPIAWDELPLELKEQVFPKGKPEANQAFAGDVMQFVRSMPLRKDHSSLQGVAELASSSSAETISTPMSVDAICKVVEACSRGMQQQGGASHAASSSLQLPTMAAATPHGGLLALEDGRVEDSEPKGFQKPEKGAALEDGKEQEMTVERQLQDLQALAHGLAGSVLKRPAAKKGVKRPALKAQRRSSGSFRRLWKSNLCPSPCGCSVDLRRRL